MLLRITYYFVFLLSFKKLNKHHCLKSISDSIRRGDFSISQSGIPELRHFLYKSRSTAQFTSPRFEAPYTTSEDQQRVFRLYQYLHQRLHSNSRPLKILFHVGPNETLLGWVSQAATHDFNQMLNIISLMCEMEK